MAERPSDADILSRIDELEQGYLERARSNRAAINKLAGRTYRLLTLLILATLFLAYLVFQQQSQATSAATRARKIALTVARNRHQTIFQNCKDQNARNRGTSRILDQRIAQLARQQPTRAAQLRSSRQFTISLIAALAPVQNCLALANRQAPLGAQQKPRQRGG